MQSSAELDELQQATYLLMSDAASRDIDLPLKKHGGLNAVRSPPVTMDECSQRPESCYNCVAPPWSWSTFHSSDRPQRCVALTDQSFTSHRRLGVDVLLGTTTREQRLAYPRVKGLRTKHRPDSADHAPLRAAVHAKNKIEPFFPKLRCGIAIGADIAMQKHLLAYTERLEPT